MAMPDGIQAVRKAIADVSALTTHFGGRIYSYEIPRAIVDGGLKRKILLLVPSGRAPGPGDYGRALIGRPRFDAWSYGETFGEAAKGHWLVYEFLKDLGRVRAVLSGGTALIHDCTVEGGPLQFIDPDSDAPVVVGIYATSVAEEFLVTA